MDDKIKTIKTIKTFKLDKKDLAFLHAWVDWYLEDEQGESDKLSNDFDDCVKTYVDEALLHAIVFSHDYEYKLPKGYVFLWEGNDKIHVVKE